MDDQPVPPLVDALADDHSFDPADPKRGGWALVEVMGHRSHHGFLREITMFGAAMCEVLVPFHDKPGVQFRHVYAGSALFSVTPRPRAACIEKAPRTWPETSPLQLRPASYDDDDDDEREPADWSDEP